MGEANKELWSVEEICDTLNKTAATDKDNINAVDGQTGSGKSTLAIKLCMKGCEWFDMEKDILYSRKELTEWVTNARPGSWGVADEAVNVLFKRDFQMGGQKFLLKVLDMCRSRNLTLFLCIPNFWALDKHILEGRIRLRFHVAKTGLAFLWKATSNPFAPDRWCRKYNEKVCYNWDSYPNARRTKGFVGYIKFGDLGVDQKRNYIAIKERKKAEVKAAEEQEEQEEEKAKKRSVELGKIMALEYMDRKSMFKPGWHGIWAEFQGVGRVAIIQQLKRFRMNGNLGEAIKNPNKSPELIDIPNKSDELFCKPSNSNKLYNNNSYNDNLNQTTEGD